MARRPPRGGALGSLLFLIMVVAPTQPRSQSLIAGATRAADQPRSGTPAPVGRLSGDFNGDGFADLAVGATGQDIGSADGAGAVNVIYGSGSGLSDAANQFWNQDSPGVKGVAGTTDAFGWSSATADFDGDGFADLAIGVYRERVGVADLAGAVNVLYGDATGLSSDGNQIWAQDSPAIKGVSGYGELFGQSLVAGDFNGDGLGDLAIGVPGEHQAGAVNVIYGSPAGLASTGNQLWSQETPGILDRSESADAFGGALAAGDFDGDGVDDLAVGHPGESSGPLNEHGSLSVIYGSTGGLTADGNQLWSQGRDGLLDQAERSDQFGWALAADDLNGDGFDDLAASAYWEQVDSTVVAGSVSVIYGSGDGLASAGNQVWNQDSPGILDQAETGDEFGYSLGAGDLDGDGFGDLVVGIPVEEIVAFGDGAVAAIYGSPAGLADAGNQIWSQDTPGIPDDSETGDALGWAVAVSDLNGDGFADLSVGVRSEDVGDVPLAGSVNVIYGSAGGLTDLGSQVWSQDSPGILDQAEDFDLFGASVG